MPPLPPNNPNQPPLSDEEKRQAELQRLFEADLKKAQEALKVDGKDTFVRSQ